MSSSSLKDVAKAIQSYVPDARLPLPDDLLDLIHSYLDKRSPIEDSESQKVQDELLSIYQQDVKGQPKRYAVFLAILRQLRPAIRGPARFLQWWDTLVLPVLPYLAEQRGLAVETSGILLEILVYDSEEGEASEAAQTSAVLSEKLLELWLTTSNAVSSGADAAAHFLEEQIKHVLLTFGKRRSKDFLMSMDKFFVKKEYRGQVLSLLCDFFRYGPPHLHQLLQTPLFLNLLRCLQIDTSTTIVSLAMTALTMFLPHIPNSSGKHLPALFNIYARMLFWERERLLSPGFQEDAGKAGEELSEKADGKTSSEIAGWEKLSHSSESEDQTVCELLHYFTFLYGLYPINFMSYIRKPLRYLRHANFAGADDLDVENSEIRQRSEPFRQVHLLHQNFFSMTIESEISDPNRWMNSDPADVVASCMALYSPVQHGVNNINGGPPFFRLQDASSYRGSNGDIPPQPLAIDADGLDSRRTSVEGANVSWRNTTSTMVASPDRGMETSNLARISSSTNQSIFSVVESPTTRPQMDRLDSPTIPPHVHLQSPVQNFLDSNKSLRGNLHQSLANESSTTLSSAQPSQEPSVAVDAYLKSLSHQPRSPSLRPSTVEGQTSVASLQREIILLKNDLNFERYLKDQHLSHIGQLRRKQVRQVTAEAETQNLINANRVLRTKLEEAKNAMAQTKKEFEKSRNQSRNWDADLTAKIRALKEEQKKWTMERDNLIPELAAAIGNGQQMKLIVVGSEARELASQQRLQSVQLDLEELERLRAEVEKMKAMIRTYEAREAESEDAKSSEAIAFAKLNDLEVKLMARDEEFERTNRANKTEIESLRAQLGSAQKDGHKQQFDDLQAMLDTALASSRSRLVEAQKAHAHLLKQFTTLQQEYLMLQDQEYQQGPLLSGIDSLRYEDDYDYHSGSPSPDQGRNRDGVLSDLKRFDSGSPVSKATTGFPLTSLKTDIPRSGEQLGDARPQSQRARGSELGGVDGGIASTSKTEPEQISPTKIKPQSEIRVYGRAFLSPSFHCDSLQPSHKARLWASLIQVVDKRVVFYVKSWFFIETTVDSSNTVSCIGLQSLFYVFNDIDQESIFSFRSTNRAILTKGLGGPQNIGKTPKDKKKKEDLDKLLKKSSGIRGLRGFV